MSAEPAADDDFGDLTPWTQEEFEAAARRAICQPDEPWVDASTWPAGDHGHTLCMFVGGLLAEVLRLRGECEQLRTQLATARDLCSRAGFCGEGIT